MNAIERGHDATLSPARASRGHRSLRAYLLALALLVLVPTFGIGLGVAYLVVREHQRDFMVRLTDGAEAIAAALGRHIEARQMVLATLANFPAPDNPEEIDARFRALVTSAAAMLGETVAVFRRDGTPIFRANDPSGEVARAPVSVEAIRRAVATRHSVVGNLITEPRWTVPIMIPVLREDWAVAVLSVRLSREAMLSVLSKAKPEGASFVTILDANGRILTRAPESGTIGEVAPQWLRDAPKTNPEGGLTRGTTLTGVETIAAVQPVVSAPGWTVVVAAPLSALTKLSARPTAWLVAGGAAMLGLAITVALLISRRLLQPVETLTRHAEGCAFATEATPVGPFPVTEFESLRRALARAEAERRKAEEMQSLLTREVDHRSKNLLAVVQAVLRMTKAESTAEFVKAVSDRVAALARAHSLLAEKGWSGSSLRAVVEGELVACGEPGRAALHGADVPLIASAVQPISTVLHELATNAARHGALSTKEGRIEVAWRRDEVEGILYLCWRETGGPPVEGPPARRGFGSRVVNTTIAGLGGKVDRQWAASGLVFEMWVPIARVVNVETSPR